MDRLKQKISSNRMRKNRIRAVIAGNSESPRLSVFISNKNISAQIIDDSKGATLAYVTTVGSKDAKGNMTEKAQWLGAEIAKKAKAKKVKKVVFDRNGKLYHGRVKALADAARKSGLEF